jgi:hypothetical protein
MWTRIKLFVKSARGKLAIALGGLPLWRQLYELIDAWGNFQTVKDWLPNNWGFLTSTGGTYIVMIVGFALGGYQLLKQSKQVNTKHETPIKHLGVELADSLGCLAVWVHDVEQFDREGIHNAVITERCEIIRSNYNYSPGNRPFVEFRCTVFNGSVFPIGTSESHEGYIRFQDQPLDGLIRISKMIVNLAHAHRGQFTIRQSLNRDEAEAISRAGPDAQFHFGSLTIYVESGNGVTPQPLSLVSVYKDGRPV